MFCFLCAGGAAFEAAVIDGNQFGGLPFLAENLKYLRHAQNTFAVITHDDVLCSRSRD